MVDFPAVVDKNRGYCLRHSPTCGLMMIDVDLGDLQDIPLAKLKQRPGANPSPRVSSSNILKSS
jgi:hypothetical protein